MTRERQHLLPFSVVVEPLCNNPSILTIPQQTSSNSMTIHNRRFNELLEHLRRLPAQLDELRNLSTGLEITPLLSRSWYELLMGKLLPQAKYGGVLIVSVVGGTNIGKTAIFNHLAGQVINQVSPFASGTKHPVCLYPEKMDVDYLKDLFSEFVVEPLTNPTQSLEESPRDFLFCNQSPTSPENLLLLDTPDIDSDAKVNWARAEKICLASDVLIAVLTQQKYNDAAVKRFFRDAARQGKVVCVVFNQCFLPDDELYWPRWLETFTTETGVKPFRVYLAPHDRLAVQENRLPFYEREKTATSSSENSPPVDLKSVFSELEFATIKLQTMAGAIAEVVDQRVGLPAYLDDLKRASTRYVDAVAVLTKQRLTKIDHWPNIPNRLLITKIRGWWKEQRQGWPARMHQTYDSLGKIVLWPVTYAMGGGKDQNADRLEDYQHKEWATIILIVNQTFEQLENLQQEGNALLKARLESLLSGHSRQQMFDQLRTEYQAAPLDELITQVVDEQLSSFRQDSPEYYQFFRRLDTFAAAMRPATSVALFVTGVGPIGHALTPVLFDAATQTMLHLVGDVTAGAVTAAVGDVAIAGPGAAAAGYLEAKFRRLHERIIEKRVTWLADLLQRKFLGELIDELTSLAELPSHPAFDQLRDLVEILQQHLRLLQADTPTSNATVQSNPMITNTGDLKTT